MPACSDVACELPDRRTWGGSISKSSPAKFAANMTTPRLAGDWGSFFSEQNLDWPAKATRNGAHARNQAKCPNPSCVCVMPDISGDPADWTGVSKGINE